MFFKIIIGLLLLIVLYCLGSGLFYLTKGSNGSDKLIKSLTWRIGLSVFIFALLLVAFLMGWVKPHGV